MEPANSVIQYWWLLIPLPAVLYFGHVTWNHIRSRAHQLAFASLVLGIAGLLFWLLGPLAVYCSRRARRLGIDPGSPGLMMLRCGAVLGYIGSVMLGLVLLMAGIYFFAWMTGQYPYN